MNSSRDREPQNQVPAAQKLEPRQNTGGSGQEACLSHLRELGQSKTLTRSSRKELGVQDWRRYYGRLWGLTGENVTDDLIRVGGSSLQTQHGRTLRMKILQLSQQIASAFPVNHQQNVYQVAEMPAAALDKRSLGVEPAALLHYGRPARQSLWTIACSKPRLEQVRRALVQSNQSSKVSQGYPFLRRKERYIYRRRACSQSPYCSPKLSGSAKATTSGSSMAIQSKRATKLSAVMALRTILCVRESPSCCLRKARKDWGCSTEIT
eukprot:284819397_6